MRWGVAVLLLAGCREPDACTGSDEGELELGAVQPGAFVPLEDGDTVSIGDAPQGGYGVPVRVRTRGLDAGNDSTVEIELDLFLDGANAGHFELHGYPLLCESTEVGGTIGTVVVPLDPATYIDDDDVAALAGREAELAVAVTDAAGHAASVRTPVVLQPPA